uniref:Cyclin-dependent kinase inhibitor 1B n=1 Tax=Knipowitschia caucasica TaxID=637954 RepID=A0AAV2IZ45_KNICA
MSDVRLSNASPTLERVDARQPDSLRPSVRRCLFGSPDPVELQEIFQDFQQGEVRRFRDTYNFDPVEDRALSSGRFQWEADADAPEFYRRPPHGRRTGDSAPLSGETGQGQGRTPQERSRKRPSDPPGSSCTEPRTKSSRTDGEDGEAQDPEKRPEEQQQRSSSSLRSRRSSGRSDSSGAGEIL